MHPLCRHAQETVGGTRFGTAQGGFVFKQFEDSISSFPAF